MKTYTIICMICEKEICEEIEENLTATCWDCYYGKKGFAIDETTRKANP